MRTDGTRMVFLRWYLNGNGQYSAYSILTDVYPSSTEVTSGQYVHIYGRKADATAIIYLRVGYKKFRKNLTCLVF